MTAGNQVAAERKKFQPKRQTHIETPQSRNVISVGCKYPNGIHLDIREIGQPVQRVTLKGVNSLTAGAIIRPAMRGGFAITDNVPKEFFEQWMKLNKHHPGVVNNLIFAHEQHASVVDMAEDRSELSHGVDPIDPSKKIMDANGKVLLESRKEDD